MTKRKMFSNILGNNYLTISTQLIFSTGTYNSNREKVGNFSLITHCFISQRSKTRNIYNKVITNKKDYCTLAYHSSLKIECKQQERERERERERD